MNKKIISIFFLLIVLFSIVATYIYINQTSTEEEYSGSVGTVDDNIISDEVDDAFIEEDDEIEIGEMI